MNQYVLVRCLIVIGVFLLTPTEDFQLVTIIKFVLGGLLLLVGAVLIGLGFVVDAVIKRFDTPLVPGIFVFHLGAALLAR